MLGRVRFIGCILSASRYWPLQHLSAVSGTTDSPGIIPRTMDVLFNSCEDQLVNELKCKPDHYCDVMPLDDEQLARDIQLKEMLLQQYQNKV